MIDKTPNIPSHRPPSHSSVSKGHSPKKLSPIATHQPFKGTTMTQTQVKMFQASLSKQISAMFQWVIRQHKKASEKLKKEIERG